MVKFAVFISVLLAFVLKDFSVNALVKTCSPTFNEGFLSGSNELGMRWEFCTKMTFAQSGYAEWHSWAAYRDKEYFLKLFQNYVEAGPADDYEDYKPDSDPYKHLIQIDLAIYDEVGWTKMMKEVELTKKIHELKKKGEEYEHLPDPMMCEERLSHAIQTDRIKIYPNRTSIIEKKRVRKITESYDSRSQKKMDLNRYHQEFGDHDGPLSTDDYDEHDEAMAKTDQSWYYVIADCQGRLEIYRDEEKIDHLLGLDVMWNDIDEVHDYKDFEVGQAMNSPDPLMHSVDHEEHGIMTPEGEDIMHPPNLDPDNHDPEHEEDEDHIDDDEHHDG